MKRIIAIFVLSAIFLSLAGCGEQSLSETKKTLDTVNLNYTENDVLSEEEYDELKGKVKCIDGAEYRHLSNFSYSTDISASEENSLLGIRVIPVIIEDIFDEQKSEFWRAEEDYLTSIIFAILRVDESFAFSSAETNTVITESYFSDIIRNFFKFGKEKIPEIINSDKEFDVKLEELKKFGLLAVPFVLDEIKGGRTEYAEFFVAIGLHMTVNDYYINCIDHSYESLKTGEVFIGEEDFLYNTEKFDYTEWLSNNQKELRILFKYLNENCL